MLPPSPVPGLSDAHCALLRSILAECIPGVQVLAFGSRAKGTARQFSDLDLAVVADGPLSSTTKEALKDALSLSDLPFLVDVIELCQITPEFRQVILEAAIPVTPRTEHL